MLRNVKSTHNKKTGFTLVELLVVLAVTTIIGTGIAVSASQVININGSNKNRMDAIKQVENALLYINRDVQMAQTPPTISSPNFLGITYRDWDNTDHAITYSIDTSDARNHILERSESITPAGHTTTTSSITVANYVDDVNSSCSYSSSLSELTVVLTAQAGGYKSASETRTLKVRLRPIQ
jgi:prepilin-type N-terminal cleavage/methylation domain-containing protein